MSTNAARLKAPAADYPIPRSEVETDEFIYMIGELQRERTRRETLMNDELAAIKLRHEEGARPIKQQLERLMKGLQGYCEAHRAELCKGGNKYHRFGSGSVSWRWRPPRVTVRGAVLVIEALKRVKGCARFIRVREEIDKEAILRDREEFEALKLKGVSIGSAGEDFTVKPFETELEEVAS